MDAALAAAIKETRRLQQQARTSLSALRAFEDWAGHPIGVFTVQPGESLDSLVDFLRLAAAGQPSGIRVHVTAPFRGTDQGET